MFNILSEVFKYLSHDRTTTVHRKNESLKVLTTAGLQVFYFKTKKARGAKKVGFTYFFFMLKNNRRNLILDFLQYHNF